MKRRKNRQEEIPADISENQEEKKPRKRFGRKRKTDQIIRIEELEELMSKYGEGADPEDVVSMYIPHRKRRKIGAALLQLDRMQLLLMGLLLLVAILFITAFMQEKMGNFTINLNRLELYRKGISISETGDFKDATARLTASAVQDATNISIEDLPDNLDEEEGDHNGKNYMAYTYYVRNAGKEDLGYKARITLDSCAKGAEDAVRVAVCGTEPAWYMRSRQQTEATKAAAPALSPKIWFVHMKSPISLWETWTAIPLQSGWRETIPNVWIPSSEEASSSACILMLTMTMRQALYGSSSQISRIP